MNRKAFNFYRSFYDVALLLPDLERSEFLMAICHAQFTGEIIEPTLPMAKLAFTSQLHSIEKQLVGFKWATKIIPTDEPIEEPSGGAYVDPKEEPSVQEQVQVQEQEKKQSNIDSRKKDFASLLQPFIEKYGREMLNEFYYYWTEPNQRKTKMKFEMEKTWSIERRLNNWSKNSVHFGGAQSKAEKPKFNPYG